jgi:hypothetical protein
MFPGEAAIGAGDGSACEALDPSKGSATGDGRCGSHCAADPDARYSAPLHAMTHRTPQIARFALLVLAGAGAQSLIAGDAGAAPPRDLLADPAAPSAALITAIVIAFALYLANVWMLFFYYLDRISRLPELRKAFSANPQQVPSLRLAQVLLGERGVPNCVRLGCTNEGIFIRIIRPFTFHPYLLFIPVAEIREVVDRTTVVDAWFEITIGNPRPIQVRLPGWLFEGSDFGRVLGLRLPALVASHQRG